MENKFDIIDSIKAYNNTQIVRGNDDQFYIDSYKYPHVFEKHGKEAGYSIEIIHAPSNDEIRNETAGSNHAGKYFCGYVMKIIFKKKK